MTFGLPWSFNYRGKLRQQSFRFKPRDSGGQGQLRTDAGGGGMTTHLTISATTHCGDGWKNNR